MSKYTTEVRFICEHDAGLYESKGYNDVNEVLEACHSNVFSFDYPIFDEAYRPVLECKILKHFYTREICAETVGLWKLYLDARMNEIMPYYNKLYKSELLEYNPLWDTDYKREMDRDGSTNDVRSTQNIIDHSGSVTDAGMSANTRTSKQNSSDVTGGSDRASSQSAEKLDHWDYYSDTPQGAVGNLEDLSYLTNARHTTDDSTGSTASNTTQYGKTSASESEGLFGDTGSTQNVRTYGNQDTANESRTAAIQTTDDYIEHVTGKMPGQSFSKMVLEFRQTLLNIDMQIINDLNDLFMGLW